MATNYEMRPNSGALFKNKDMRPDKKDPNLAGKIMLPDGTLHWFKGWTKTTQAGEKWISCQIGDRCKEQPMASSVPPLGVAAADNDDDIPF